MTLPASGQISFNDINVELGVAGTTQASLGQTSYRNLAGVASGAISMSNFYGKSNTFAFTISTNTANANLRSLAVAAGWNQASTVVATINSGIYVYSTSTGTPAMTVNGSFPGGAQIINNGVIIGRGGNGGNTGAYASNGSPGGAGGVALSVAVPVSITNNGTVGGGGGGGGGSGNIRNANFNSYYGYYDRPTLSTGAGGGGGRGGSTAGSGSPAAGAGTLTAAGAGAYAYGNNYSASSGSGGAIGSAGGAGNGFYAGGSGGGAGACTSGNSNITWLVTGSRYGALN